MVRSTRSRQDRPDPRRLALAATVGVALLFGSAAALPQSGAQPEQRRQAPSHDRIPFDAKALVALSDADTVAQAYVNDDIGPAIGAEDTLTTIRPGGGVLGDAVHTASVTNSVWGPPTTIVTTPDGRYAIVLEVKEQREPGDVSFENDLPFSTRISVVDLSAGRPRVVQTTDTGGFAAHSLAISPGGDYVAVANWAAPGADTGIPPGEGQQISIMPFRDGRLGTPQLFGLDNIDGPNVFPNTVAWHRSGRFLAVTIGPRNLVAFYRVTHDSGQLGLEPWGAPVDGGQFPLVGTWSPNGRFFIAGAMEWNEPDVSDRNSPPGRLSIVRFDADATDGVQHTVQPGADVGINPEGLAISPDGELIVTINMRYSHLPTDFDPMRPPTTSSATLLTFDQETGATQAIGEYTFDGVLPEGVVFDRTGRHIAVAVFDFNGANEGHGAVQFWQVNHDETPSLQQLETEITTVRGTHSLSVIR